MIIQIVSLIGAIFGLWSMASLGSKAQWGWIASGVSCFAWLIVNLVFGIWPGVVYSIVGLCVSFRNWRKWRAESEASILRDTEGL